MEFLENGNFNGIKFMGNGNVYNGYLKQEQTWKEYREWAIKNILMQSEEEMKEIDDQIEAEKAEQEADQEPEGGEVPDMDSMQTTDEPEDNEGEE